MLHCDTKVKFLNCVSIKIVCSVECYIKCLKCCPVALTQTRNHFCDSFIALSMTCCLKSAPKHFFYILLFSATVVMETTQLVLSQSKTLL